MPNKRKSGARKRNKGGGMRKNQRIRMAGKVIKDLSYSASFSFNIFPFQPSAIDRLIDLHKVFELYRLIRLRATLLPACSGTVALGIVPGRTSASFTGWHFDLVAELTNAKVWWNGQTVPIHVNWNRGEIGQQLNWLRTTDADGPACTVLVGGPATTAVTAQIMIEYEVEFMGPVPSGLETVSSPMAVPYVPSNQYLVPEVKAPPARAVSLPARGRLEATSSSKRVIRGASPLMSLPTMDEDCVAPGDDVESREEAKANPKGAGRP